MKHIYNIYGFTKDESKIVCVRITAESMIDAITKVNESYPQVVIINIMDEGSVKVLNRNDIKIFNHTIDFGKFEVKIKFGERHSSYFKPKREKYDME